MPEDAFDTIARLVQSEDTARTFDWLVRRYQEERNYRALFEARLMAKRWELGLPAYLSQDLSTLTSGQQSLYGEAVTEAAREVGGLFLADGDIASAYPYLRATGDTDRIAEAIEDLEDPGDQADRLIEIAFQEGVHPAKGLQLILEKYGICQALGALGMSSVEKDRERCIGLLAREIHREIVERMASTAEQAEGARPEAASIVDLAAGRDWLFGEYSSYVDTSHLASILQYAPELTDPGLLGLFHDLCEYGKRLSVQFRVQGQVPFEDIYRDYDHYVLALIEPGVEVHLDHFRRKLADSDPQRAGTLHAQLLVKLLARLGRFAEGLEVALAHFPEASSAELNCPSAMDLCHLAGDFRRMQALAKERGDWLTYTAATMAVSRDNCVTIPIEPSPNAP